MNRTRMFSLSLESPCHEIIAVPYGWRCRALRPVRRAFFNTRRCLRRNRTEVAATAGGAVGLWAWLKWLEPATARQTARHILGQYAAKPAAQRIAAKITAKAAVKATTGVAAKTTAKSALARFLAWRLPFIGTGGALTVEDVRSWLVLFGEHLQDMALAANKDINGDWQMILVMFLAALWTLRRERTVKQ